MPNLLCLDDDEVTKAALPPPFAERCAASLPRPADCAKRLEIVRCEQLANERAEHDELKDLADAIIEAQQREIEAMRPHASGEHHG